MRWLKISLAALALIAIVVAGVSCKGSDAASATTSIVATVQKGTISNTVTGTGNLALSNTQDLAFEMAGTVQDIMVNAGQTVTKGQQLVTLDTTDWDNQIKTLQQALQTAQRNLTNAQSTVANDQSQIAAKQLAEKQSELDLQTAQDNVSQVPDIQATQTAIDNDQYNIKFAQSMIQAAAVDPGSGSDSNYWRQQVSMLTDDLNQKQKDLNDLLNGTSIKTTTDIELSIAQLQLKVEQAQQGVTTAQAAIQTAQTTLTNDQVNVTDAQQAVQDAQTNLDDANSLSPVITAPFDGFVTKINVSGGDQVQKGTVALEVADPNQFEANIMVTEQDIFSVELGQEADVSLDALPNLTFPAKVTAIAPLATVSSGVVNYKVTVELTSTTPTLPNLSGTGQNSTQTFPGGSFSTNRTTSQPSGSATPTNTPQSRPSTTPSAGSSSQSSSGASGRAAAGAITMPSITLKDGLSATVDVIIQQKQNVLIVPSRAITRQGRDSIVKLIKGNTTVDQVIQTGLSDSTNTEVVSGLNEGDQVEIQLSSSTSSTSSQAGGFPGGGNFRILGPGR
jgi:HlyD family secretion protein